jgi:Nucleotide modification associated domain 2
MMDKGCCGFTTNNSKYWHGKFDSEIESNMTKIYSYILRYDDGAAPNPFWDICTLTICKPAIRRKAAVFDWVIGTGSKNADCNDGKLHNLSDKLVFAMKITDRMNMAEYDSYCLQYLPKKIPDINSNDWRRKMGDCIYDYSDGQEPLIRESVHNEANRKRDLSGLNALLSSHFYYFGEDAAPMPDDLLFLVKQNQGHKIIENAHLIERFENWIKQFQQKVIMGQPQLKHLFIKAPINYQLASCSSCHLREDEFEDEELIC